MVIQAVVTHHRHIKMLNERFLFSNIEFAFKLTHNETMNEVHWKIASVSTHNSSFSNQILLCNVFADVRSSKLKIYLHLFLVQLFQTLTTRSFFVEFIHSVIVFLNTFPIYFVRYRNEIV